MNLFNNILVVVDAEADAQPALTQAVALAKASNAAVTVVDALEQRSDELRMFSIGGRPDIVEAVVQDRAARLEDLVRATDTGSLRIETQVLYGTAFIEIIKMVIQHKHDLVIRSASERDTKHRLLFGGTAMSLIRKCPCPVWVLGPEADTAVGRIMAAVNPIPSEPGTVVLSERVIRVANSLSSMFQADLHVVHAWTFYYEKTLRNRLDIAPEEVDRIVRDIESAYRSGVDALVRKCNVTLPPRQLHFLRGRPSVLIPDAVESQQIDLLVMGSVARAGIPGLLVGNTAEKILQKVDCAVLTLKPEGFVSPVKG